MVGSPPMPKPITEEEFFSLSAGMGLPSPDMSILRPPGSCRGVKYPMIVPRNSRPVRPLNTPMNFWRNPLRVVV